MSLGKEIEKLKFDKRLIDWHVNRGKLSKEEKEKHLNSLPDCSDNVETLKLENEPGEGNGNGSHM